MFLKRTLSHTCSDYRRLLYLKQKTNKQKKTSVRKLLHCRKDSEWHKDPKERQPRTSKTLEFSLGT